MKQPNCEPSSATHGSLAAPIAPIADPFSPERAGLLARTDLLEYFTAMLAELNPTLQKRPWLKTLRPGLEEIRLLIDMPEGKPFEPAQVKSIYEKSSALVKLVTGAE